MKKRSPKKFANAPAPAPAAAATDFFRGPQPEPAYPTQPEPSIIPARLTTSVQMRWNPIRGLTPERLTSYLDQWRFGFFRSAAMTWDAMERRDYQIKTDAPKRKKAVTRHGYDVLTLSNLPAGQTSLAQAQQDFLRNFYDHLTATDVLNPDDQGGLSLLLRQMMDAVGKYYSVHEIIWQPQPDGNLTAKFIFCPIWWFEGTQGKLRYLDSEFQIYGREIFPGDWLITCGDGIMEACSVLYIFKHLPLKSWLSYLDKLGIPGLLLKTDAQKGSREWNDAVEALQAFSTDYAAVTNRSVELSLIEAKGAGSGGALFDTLVDKMDRAITQLWRGADLASQSKADATGSNRQKDETELLENDDNKMLEERLATGVSRYALEWKFGAGCPQLAYLKLRTAPRQATAIDIQVDQFLLAAGVALGADSTRERYSRPTPSEGEELLQAPAAPEPADPAAELHAQKSEISNQKSELGLHPLAAAVAQDLAPVAARLAAILRIADGPLFDAKLKAFLADLDQLKRDISHDPASAHELEKIISSALMNGLARTQPKTDNRKQK